MEGALGREKLLPLTWERWKRSWFFANASGPPVVRAGATESVRCLFADPFLG